MKPTSPAPSARGEIFYSVDRDWRITTLSDRAVELLGRPRSSLLGVVMWDLLEGSGIEATEVYRHHAAVMRDRQPRTIELAPEGLREWVALSIFPREDGGLAIHVRDIGEAKRAQDALRLEHRRFLSLVENIDELFYIVDREFRFTHVSPRTLDAWGKSLDEVIGRRYEDVFPSARDSEALRLQMEAAATGRPIEREITSPQRNEWTWLRVYPAGSAGTLVYFRDISDRKRTEAALEARVVSRTSDLERASTLLQREIVEHRQTEAARHDLLARLSSAQEEERRRLSHELHDEVGQHLAALSVELRAAADLAPAGSELACRIDKVSSIAGILGRELHAIAVQLRPRALDDFGLGPALEGLIRESSERMGIHADIHIDLEDTRLPAAVETAVFRIVQEALTNVVKHSGASQVSVILDASDRELRIVVEDNGGGFDTEDLARTDRSGSQLGLAGIRDRAAIVGGVMEIESGREGGTAIYVRIPVRAVPADAETR